MKIIAFVISCVITVALVLVLNRPWGPIPPMGKFLSPQHGFWQNAEPADENYSAHIPFLEMKGKGNVYIDDRLVPHIFAEYEDDAWFMQGYLHARFRLWQMEFQVFAAAGRLSEILGPGEDGQLLKMDRSMRRLGMVYAAEQSIKAVEENPVSQKQYEAYAKGVNTYIDQLTESTLPLEYKLLNYKPEHWDVFKTALLLKFMSYSLAGHEEDLPFTNARKIFSHTEFEKLYPIFADSLKPVVPNTPADQYPTQPVVNLNPPVGADQLYFNFKPDSSAPTSTEVQPAADNGSNNWAVAPSKTASGAPILCNDPHLDLALPSLWYEMQITTPTFNAYGVSFPGSPNIIIGFNDSIAFGFTNAGRDVKDYYDIRFRDSSMTEYWFDSSWVAATPRIERIKVKGQPTLEDTVMYTIYGPVMYDRHFPAPGQKGKTLAVRWKAHDPSNDGYTFYGLNHAKNYADYLEAIRNYTCPGQNCLFASKSGDIAIWQQGVFPAKWRRQGDFIMPGSDSSYMWRDTIPQVENPHMVNPERGYVSSANQLAVDSTYPYYLGPSFPVYRAYTINHMLDHMSNITVEEMEKMQTSNYNVKAEFARDILLQTDEKRLGPDEIRYLNIFREWQLQNDTAEKGATVFTVWWRALENAVWKDDFSRSKLELPFPQENVLVEALHRDSAYSFIDDITTPQKETLADVLVTSLKKATVTLKQLEADGKLGWSRYKGTHVTHLLRLEPFSRNYVEVGGGTGTINATRDNHGPSWRMIVQLTDSTQAYGVYPGGQNGNPGSRFYDNYIDTWAAGQYYPLWFMKRGDEEDHRIKWCISFDKF